MRPYANRRRPSRTAWWERLVPKRVRKITQLHVSVTALVVLFMLVFYVLMLFQPVHWPLTRFLNAAYLVGSLAILATVYWRGDKLPPWLMYVAAMAEVAAFVFFIAFSRNEQQIVFRLQQFPLTALYLSWIFPAWLARLSIYPPLVFSVPYGLFVGPLAGTEDSNGPLNIASLVFFTVLGMGVGAFVRERFRQQVEFDELTGALNRRGLSAYAEPALLRARKRSQPLCVAVVDLDNFKCVNDTQGHSAGDQVLQDLVRHWLGSVRGSDMVCRLGGDEFVLVFPDTSLPEAEALMERLRSTSQSAWSYGLIEASEEDNLSTAVLRADRAMYSSKRTR